MKVTKMKAWDNVENKMYTVGGETDMHFYFDSEGIKAERFFDTIHYTPEGGSDICGDSETLEHLIYLQFAGVKDKDGVEIYEGDLVEHEMEVNGLWEPYEACPVVFNEEYGIFCFEWDAPNVMAEYGNLKVIGNIYEGEEQK